MLSSFRRTLHQKTFFNVQSRKLSSSGSIKRVGILGAGQMGGGIAQVAAQVAGLDVLLMDNSQSSLDRSLKLIGTLFDKNIAKGKATEEEKRNTLNRISTTTEFSKFKDVDIVIEAVSENPAVKDAIFRQLDEITRVDTILASNHRPYL